MYLITSRTAGDHCQKASAANPAASSGSAHARFVHGRPQMAHSEHRPAEERAEPHRVAAHLRVEEERERGARAVERGAPAERALLARGSTSRQTIANSGIGR